MIPDAILVQEILTLQGVFVNEHPAANLLL
jgi:hypothetical protein